MPDQLLTRTELRTRLTRAHSVTTLQRFNATIDGQRAFVRDGSDKLKGWQITIRDDLRLTIPNGQGFLIVPRGPGLLIPLVRLRSMIGKEVGQHNTVDIFVTFQPVARMECKGCYFDLSQYIL